MFDVSKIYWRVKSKSIHCFAEKFYSLFCGSYSLTVVLLVDVLSIMRLPKKSGRVKTFNFWPVRNSWLRALFLNWKRRRKSLAASSFRTVRIPKKKFCQYNDYKFLTLIHIFVLENEQSSQSPPAEIMWFPIAVQYGIFHSFCSRFSCEIISKWPVRVFLFREPHH